MEGHGPYYDLYRVCMVAAGDVDEVKGSCEKAIITPRVELFGHTEDWKETSCDDVNGLRSSNFYGRRSYVLYVPGIDHTC